MLNTALLLLVGLGQLQETSAIADPSALVLQLGAPRYADRQAATEALERIGAGAVHALRAARASRVMEIKTRSARILFKIETALLTEPTSVRLDFDGTPLSEVAQSLSQQTGFKIALYPQNLARWKNQRVTLHSTQPLNFWKAIDEVCDAASLQYNPSMQGFIGPGEPVFALTEGVVRTLTPISDQGPFRVRLLSIDYQRRLNYAPSGRDATTVPPPPRPAERAGQARGAAGLARLNPVTTVEFTAQLLVAAEPRIALGQHGDPRLVEAVDDHGNSLIPVGRRSQSASFGGYFGTPHGPVMESHVPLLRPALPGDTIKKLRGSIPATISSRRPNPLVVPLEKSVGRTFENPDVQLTIHDIRALPDSRHTLVELSIKTDRPEATPGSDAEAYNSIFQRANHQQLQIDIVDIHDHLISWFQSLADAESSHVTLTLNTTNPTAPPKELRYYVVTRTDVEIPFEFTDVPMP